MSTKQHDRLQWFKFYPQDWVMGKIQRCSELAQARFILLCSIYWNNRCLLSERDAIDHLTQKVFNELVERRIVKNNDGMIEIEFLNDQYDEITTGIQKMRELGRRGGQASAKGRSSETQPNGQGSVEKNRIDIDKEKNPPTPLEIALDEFAHMRKQIKKPLTERARELTIMKLEKMAPDDDTKIEILYQSIMNSWQGVFELKSDHVPILKTKAKGKSKYSALERLRAEQEKRNQKHQ